MTWLVLKIGKKAQFVRKLTNIYAAAGVLRSADGPAGVVSETSFARPSADTPLGTLTVDSALKKDFEYYIAHQSEFVQKYNGRVIVIKGEKVLGDYETEVQAITATTRDHALGSFLVQPVSPGNASYAQNFHSRVAFS